MTRRVIIDTDGGVDDAVALWWAVTEPSLDVVAITVVWGNVGVETATRAVLTVLAAVGRLDIPVVAGEGSPFQPAPPLRPATFVHGDDGLGNTGRTPPENATVLADAPGYIVERLRREPGEIDLVTIGPMTNVARALRQDANVARNARSLVVMGGAARTPGNALPLGEANIAHDPVAAAEVLGASWTTPPLLVGLDATYRATLTQAEFDLLAEHRVPAAAFLDAPMRFYREAGGTFTVPECPCHDLLAVMALADPDLVTDAPVLPVAVDLGGGPAWGTTVVDFRHVLSGGRVPAAGAAQGFSPCRVALDVDVVTFRRRLRALFGEHAGDQA
jgi:purine nucleosidase